MNNLELHHFRCIVALAEELNFGRAAVRLHMSQPPLTRILSEAERLVGARLFERTTRKVSLTPVGEVFVSEARAVLARTEAAAEMVRAALRNQAGQLRLAYTPLALMTVLPEILSEMREREHEVSIDLAELTGQAQWDALFRGQVDMGFADEPVQEDAEGAADFTNVRLHREAVQVVLPEHHRLAKSDTVTFAALAQETFVLHARHDYPRYHDRVLQACDEAGFAPKIYYREARQNCAALVAAGYGILLSPANNQTAAVPGFRRVPLTDAPASLFLEVWAILPNKANKPALKSLRQIIEARRTAQAIDTKTV